MDNSKYDVLKLDNQLCFPLYVVAKETIRLYRPYLDPLGITYTQYITMMVLWEYGTISVKDLGTKLFLDSGTLTPVIKALEKKGYITKTHSNVDERVVNVSVTNEGMSLRDKLVDLPPTMAKCVNLEKDEIVSLYKSLYKLLGKIV